MAVDLHALVLPAFENLEGLPGEVTPWRAAYDLDRTVRIEGVPSPLRYTDGGLGVVPTGVGKSAAATTTAALCASDAVDLDDALFLSVGAAGGPPQLAVGSVVLADCVVDWDDKCRFDSTDRVPLSLNPYTRDAGVFDLDPARVESAWSAAEGVELTPVDAGSADPELVVGTNLCGDELWHGRRLAEQAAWLVGEHDRGPYRATEMEDAGTAAALARFDRLDRYLSVRGISNRDRPEEGVSAERSFSDPAFESGFEVGIENAVRVARAIIDARTTV